MTQIPCCNPKSFKLLAGLLVLTFSGAPQVLAQAAQQPAPADNQAQSTQTAPATQTPAQRPSGVVPDPAAAPLQPAPSNLPDAPSTPAPAPSAPPRVAPQSAPQQQPLGAAAAEAARTSGGAASKPAGSAIAPAKQKQVRSLLIKLGIIAAAGAALGTVYALSRGTSSTPPGATSTAASTGR
jgi:hypothetical protein